MARLVLLLLLWVGVTLSTGLNLQKRILGGKECEETERLYHVQLTINGNFACGGSLISHEWILTAAHCWPKKGTMEAILGVHRGPKVQKQIIKHKIFRAIIRHHDLMLLKIPETDQHPHVNLPTEDECKNRPQTVQIAGHGNATALPGQLKNGTASPTLQCADIDVVDCDVYRDVLQKYDNEFYKTVKNDHWFCGQSPGVDTCRGDSGGGVVHGNTIYGVIAFGGKRACVTPATFMDVCNSDYLKWINETITKKNEGCGLLCG